jgi:hypothetical protein
VFVYNCLKDKLKCYQDGGIMPTDRIQTGIRFKEDVLEKITFIAKVNCRSLNAQLEFITKQCIEQYEREHGEIKATKKEESP